MHLMQMVFAWAAPVRPEAGPRPKAPTATRSTRTGKPMQERYDALVDEMKRTYGFRVRKWRTSMSGCAWEVHYVDGRIVRLIESPYPRGPMSCAVFLHEVGHHAIGLGCCKPRCLEEYRAWAWSLQAMRERNLNVSPRVEQRMCESVVWAIEKGRRRGLQSIPVELVDYLESVGFLSRS